MFFADQFCFSLIQHIFSLALCAPLVGQSGGVCAALWGGSVVRDNCYAASKFDGTLAEMFAIRAFGEIRSVSAITTHCVSLFLSLSADFSLSIYIYHIYIIYMHTYM